jgi:hypothetical protein
MAAEERRPPMRQALRPMIEENNGDVSTAAAAMACEVAARRQQMPVHGSAAAGQGAVLQSPKPHGSDTYWLFRPIYVKVHAGCPYGTRACVVYQALIQTASPMSTLLVSYHPKRHAATSHKGRTATFYDMWGIIC